MNDGVLALDKNEEDLLVANITDQALESAVYLDGKAGGFTLAGCTFLTLCPGP